MAIISCSNRQQDTVQGIINVINDSTGIKPDSASTINTIQSDDSVTRILTPVPKSFIYAFNNTISTDRINSDADITFYDSVNFINKAEPSADTNLPLIFTDKSWQMKIEARASLNKHLKPGQDLPVQALHEDWILIIILLTALLFSFIRDKSKIMLPGITRFLLFRSIIDPSSRDLEGIFRWQSTIINLISFLNIGLFAYFAAYYYDIIPTGISGIIFWLISLGVIISAITLRHIACLITGKISGETEVFREYMLWIYQSYRYSALFLFILIILISYTTLFPASVSFISGGIMLGIMYLIRIIRLIIIFLNHNISIFYLILYLCALEILPVLISVKYFTGLF